MDAGVIEERARVDFGPNRGEVDALLGQARHLTAAQVRGLAGAVAWRWVPLGLPSTAGVLSARAHASLAGRQAGREGSIASATSAARMAALESPGAQEVARPWSWAESGFLALVLGVPGAVFFAASGLAVLAIALALVAVAGGVALLIVESGSVARARLAASASAAALAVTTRDLITAAEFEALYGPWSSVFRD